MRVKPTTEPNRSTSPPGPHGDFHAIIADNAQRAAAALSRLHKQSPTHLRVYTLRGPGGRDPQKMVTIWELLDLKDGDYFLVMSGLDSRSLVNDNIRPGDVLHMRPDIECQSGDIVHVSGIDASGAEFVRVLHIHQEPGSDSALLWANNDEGATVPVKAGQITIHGVLVGFVHCGRGADMAGVDITAE
jgi:hypothetical protein